MAEILRPTFQQVGTIRYGKCARAGGLGQQGRLPSHQWPHDQGAPLFRFGRQADVTALSIAATISATNALAVRFESMSDRRPCKLRCGDDLFLQSVRVDRAEPGKSAGSIAQGARPYDPTSKLRLRNAGTLAALCRLIASSRLGAMDWQRNCWRSESPMCSSRRVDTSASASARWALPR